ncbi:MAG: GFA family protein [Pseudomonadota bacterium]
MIDHVGGCHCGRVRFRVRAPRSITVSQCNCSICTKSGYLGLIVPKENFTLLRGAEDLSEYRFNTNTAAHTFCRHCGIKSFYYPRSHPDGVNVNARCLDEGTVLKLKVCEVDGQNWEAEYPADQARTYRFDDG